MQSTTSLFRSSIRRSIPLIRPYSAASGSTGASTSSASQQQAQPSESQTDATSNSNSSSTSDSPSSSRSSPSAKIPSTSSTAEYIRTNGIPNFLPRESFENVERWLAGHWERLEGEMRCESVGYIYSVFDWPANLRVHPNRRVS
jgi:hypothetical protein